MITCFGRKNGKYQIVEGEPHVRLIFSGPDAHLFEQANQPLEPIEEVRFTFTVACLRKEFPGFLEGECRCGVPGCKEPASLVRINKEHNKHKGETAVSNRSKKHTHQHSEIFDGLLGPLTILAEPLFDVETAELIPCIFATLPNGQAVELDDMHFGHNSCMECETAAGVREDYPMGNRDEYQQEIPGSLFFGLKAGDTILANVSRDYEMEENCYWAHVVWIIADGIAKRTQGPQHHLEAARPALVS